MATILDTFITQFKWDVDDSGIKKAEKKVTDFKVGAIKVLGIIGAVFTGSAFINKVANAADETLKFADANGVAIERVQELEFATQRQGGSVNGLRGTLVSLNKTLGEVSRGIGGGIDVFKRYGLSARDASGQIKQSDEFLLELNGTFQALNRQQQIDLASKLGIDSGTMRVLQLAPTQLQKVINQARQFGVTSRQEAESAAAFNDSLTNVGQALSFIGTVIGAKLFVPLSELINWFAKGVSVIGKHERILKVLGGTILLLSGYYTVLKIKAVGAWLAAAAPIVGTIALIAGLILLVEDLWAAFEGGESVSGKLWKKLNKGAEDYFTYLHDEFPVVFDTIAGTLDDIESLATSVMAVVKDVIDAVIKDIESSLAFVKAIPTGIKAFIYGTENTATPAPGGGTTNSRSSSLSVDNVNITVPSGSPEIIAREFKNELGSVFRIGAHEFDSDVRY